MNLPTLAVLPLFLVKSELQICNSNLLSLDWFYRRRFQFYENASNSLSCAIFNPLSYSASLN